MEVMSGIVGDFAKIAYESNTSHAFQAQNEQEKEQRAGFSVPAEKPNTDQVTISDEAKSLASDKENAANKEKSQSDETLTEEEQKQVEDLKKRDAEVRAHEQAHLSASGGLAQGGASLTYDNGPDGKRYANGGEVSIDVSSVPNDPQASLIKAQKIRRAALAPSDPSSQDRSVAADASRMEAEARVEVAKQSREQDSGSNTENNTKTIQNEKNIQESYTKIQNNYAMQQQVLRENRTNVDFFI